MNNLQDELAWLNHRLDNKLEEWRKLHRLHGRFNVFLMYCLLIIGIAILFTCINGSNDVKELSVFALSVATVASMLSFGVLSWMLYGRLLTLGHESKDRIEYSHVASPGILKESFLKGFLGEFNNLLRIERGFPFSDQIRRETRARLKACCNWLKRIAQTMNLTLAIWRLKRQLKRLQEQFNKSEKERKEIAKSAAKLRLHLQNTNKRFDKIANEIKAEQGRGKTRQLNTPPVDRGTGNK